MKYIATIILALAISMCGCSTQQPRTRIALTQADIARIETTIPTLTPGMTETEAFRRLGLFPIKKYSRRGSGGGQDTHYHFDYRLGDCGILSVIYNRKNLSRIEFWNQATRTKTTSKELSEPAH